MVYMVLSLEKVIIRIPGPILVLRANLFSLEIMDCSVIQGVDRYQLKVMYEAPSTPSEVLSHRKAPPACARQKYKTLYLNGSDRAPLPVVRKASCPCSLIFALHLIFIYKSFPWVKLRLLCHIKRELSNKLMYIVHSLGTSIFCLCCFLEKDR